MGINISFSRSNTQTNDEETPTVEEAEALISRDPGRAVEIYELAIAQGDVRAMVDFAYLLHSGAAGIPKDITLAINLYEAAIAKGERGGAMNNLAMLYEHGDEQYLPKNPRKAVELYQCAIDEDAHVSAMYNLAVLLETGADGVPIDVSRAVSLYTRAVREGADVDAAFNLAILFQKGKGEVQRDLKKAVEMYEFAVTSGGRVDAMFDLANLLLKDDEIVEKDAPRAIQLFEEAIAAGHTGAMNNLATMLHVGDIYLHRDLPRAVTLYQRAVDEGNHIDAMNNLAVLLVDGPLPVDIDTKQAAMLYERAIAEGGHTEAMFNLALLLEEGTGSVPKHTERAVALYEQAITDGNHIGAMYNLAVILKDGKGDEVARDVGRAVKLYERAISEGRHFGAMNNLAVLLEQEARHEGSSAVRAVSLYERAVSEGCLVQAMHNLAVLLENGGNGVEGNAASAKGLYERAIADGGYSPAMGSLALLLRSGAKGVTKDVSRAVKLFQQAIEISFEPVYMFLLAGVLLSEDVGNLRDPPRAKILLERAIAVDAKFAPALHELAVLLSLGDDGVPCNPFLAQALFERARSEGRMESKQFALAGWTRREIEAGDSFNDSVEFVLRTATVRSRQCFLLMAGGGGRGKTSLVRSLQGRPFVAQHFSTEVVDLKRVAFVPGDRIMNDSAITELVFSIESLVGHMTRASDMEDVRSHSFELPTSGFLNRWDDPGYLHVDINSKRQITVSNVQNVDESLARLPTRVRPPSSSTPPPKDLRRGSSGDFSLDRNCVLPHKRLPPGLVLPVLVLPPSCAQVSMRKGVSPHHPIQEQHQEQEQVLEQPRMGSGLHFSRIGRKGYSKVLRRARQGLHTNSFSEGNCSAIVQCWDLAGQSPFVMAHSIFIGPASIVIIAVNLENVANQENRHQEIKVACRWVDLVFSLSHKPQVVQLILVGTRRLSCGDVNEVRRLLMDGMKYELGDAAYNTWFRTGGGPLVQFVAIENSQADLFPQQSGLEELDRLICEASSEIVCRRDPVPIRWIALVEELEKIEIVFLTQEEVMVFVEAFPPFRKQSHDNEQDVMDALRYYRDVGRLVLLEVPDEVLGEQFYLFMHPTKIVDFIRLVTVPDSLSRQGLDRQDAIHLDKGLLTKKGLDVLWREYSEKERSVMLRLLCRFDLLMRVPSCNVDDVGHKELIAIPAMLRSGMEGFQWAVKPGEQELHARSQYENVIPIGLKGVIISHLHKTVGGGRTKVGFLRSNAALLGAKMSCGDSGQVLVAFDDENCGLTWTIRARQPMKIMHMCIKALETCVRGRTRRFCTLWRHKIVLDCKKRPHGCNGTRSVFFEIPKRWAEGNAEEKLPNMEGDCLCEETWGFEELSAMITCEADTELKSIPAQIWTSVTPYDVFISHAGVDKHTIAFPLKRALEAFGLRCFLDEEDLRPSYKTGGEQIYAAMRGSKAVIFILSVAFAARKWPIAELRYFFELREMAVKGRREGVTLMPMFYGLTVEQCKTEGLPYCASHTEQFRSHGFFSQERQREGDTHKVMTLLTNLSGFVGVRNDNKMERGEDFAKRGAQFFSQQCKFLGGL